MVLGEMDFARVVRWSSLTTSTVGDWDASLQPETATNSVGGGEGGWSFAKYYVDDVHHARISGGVGEEGQNTERIKREKKRTPD